MRLAHLTIEKNQTNGGNENDQQLLTFERERERELKVV